MFKTFLKNMENLKWYEILNACIIYDMYMIVFTMGGLSTQHLAQ